MKIERVLHNPTPKDLKAIKDSEEKKQKEKKIKTSKTQLRFTESSRQIKLKQFRNSFQHKMQRRLLLLEMSPFWRSPAVPFFIATALGNIAILLFVVLFKSDLLPNSVRFFYNATENEWATIQKDSLWIYVAVSFITLAIQLRFIQLIFKYDKRLAFSIAWVFSFLQALFFISLISLIRVYALV